jgi:hypothetical protein
LFLISAQIKFSKRSLLKRGSGRFCINPQSQKGQGFAAGDKPQPYDKGEFRNGSDNHGEVPRVETQGKDAFGKAVGLLNGGLSPDQLRVPEEPTSNPGVSVRPGNAGPMGRKEAKTFRKLDESSSG